MTISDVLALLSDPKTTNLIGLLTASATIIYVAFTYKIYQANAAMVRSLVAQNERDQRPVLAAGIEVRSRVVMVLTIRNSGKSVATDIQIEIDRDFFRFGEQRAESNIRSLAAFTRPISSIAPGDRLQFDLAQGFVIFGEHGGESVTPRLFKLTFKYKWGDASFHEEQWVDLNPYLGAGYPATEEVEELEKVRKALEKIANLARDMSS